MRFFRYPPKTISRLYAGLTAEAARRLRHFDQYHYDYNTPAAATGAPGYTPQEGILIAPDVVGDRFLFVRIASIAEGGYFIVRSTGRSPVLRDGRTPIVGTTIPMAVGMNSLYFPDGDGMTVYARGASLTAMSILEQIGVMKAFPRTDGTTVPRQKVHTTFTKAKIPIDYGDKAELRISLNGANPDSDADLLSSLRKEQRFWAWPNGGNDQTDGVADWAHRELMIPASVSMFTGWSGQKGRAMGGKTGRMTISETPRYLDSADYAEVTPPVTPPAVEQQTFQIFSSPSRFQAYGVAQHRLSDDPCLLLFRVTVAAGDQPTISTTGVGANENLEISWNGISATEHFTRVGNDWRLNFPLTAGGIVEFEVR